MTGITYGYIRVSTREQNEDRQFIAMQEAGVPERNIFLDKQSGKDFDRPAYRQLMEELRPGDMVVVKGIDRLGRNYEEILEQWRHVTKEIGADIRVLDMPLLDTSIHRDLTGTLIADIVLQLLSYVAQNERENIRQRQAEGIAAAKARGVKFGRAPVKLPDTFCVYAELWLEGKISSRWAGQELGISYRTFQRRAKAFHAGG